MKRVLSLVLALVMVFGTIMPVFAEETVAAKTSGEMLQAYGLIKGTDKGLEEDQPLNRAGMATILARLNNKEDVAATYAFPASFTDVPADAWYAKTVAYAEAQAWMIGDAKGGTFRPLDNLSAQEVNILMVRALGYSDVEWADANAKAEELNIAVVAADKTLVLRGEIFTAMTATLDVPKKDETDTLGTSLALVGYTSPTPAIPEKLEVAKVMTDNLKTIIVEFNQELNKKTVVKGNFTVSGYTVEAVKLAEDNKTVTLTISGSGIAQSKEVKLTIEKIKDITDAKTVETYKEQAFVINDVTIPVIESLSVIDAKSIMIKASEPMNWSEANFTSLAGIKLDGNSFYGKVTANYVTHEYTIEFNTVKKEGSYKLTVEGVKDYAGLAAVKKEFAFDIAKDDTAPVATSAMMKTVSEVEVTFDEPVQTLGTITINGKDTNVAHKADTNKKVIVATFKDTTDKLDLGATVEVIVKYKGQKDVVGNEVKTETTLTFKVEDDTTLPTVSLEVQKANKMVITFSKAMDVETGKLIVLDKDKKVKKEYSLSTFKAKFNSAKTVLTLLATDLDDSGIKFSSTDPVTAYIQLKGLKDGTVRTNLLTTIDLAASLLDTKSPEVTANFITKDNTSDNKKDELTFFFTEAMDEDTMKNLSNYRIQKTGHANDGKTLAQISGVSVKSVSSDSKSITFYYEGVYEDRTNLEFMVYAVKDTAGSMMTTPTVTIKDGNAVELLVLAINAKGTKTLEVVFNSTIKNADPSFVKLTDKDDNPTVIAATSVSVSGSKATFTLDKDLPTDTLTFKFVEGNFKGVTNAYGTTVVDDYFGEKFSTTTKTLTDKIAPTVKAINDGKWDGTKVDDTILNFAAIEMSEKITDGGLTESDFIVKLNDKVLTDSEFNIVKESDASDKYINVEILSNSKVTVDGKYKLEVQLIRKSTLTDQSGQLNVVDVFTKSITDFNYDYTASAVSLTADTTANTVDGILEITFTDDATWRAAVTSVTYNGNAIDASAYALTSGKLTLTVANDTDLQAPLGAQDLVVVATGYANSTIAQTITHGAVQNLFVSTAPIANTRNGANAVALATNPAVTLRDKYNNTCTTAVDATVISVKSASPVAPTISSGTVSVNATAGITTYTGLELTPGSDANVSALIFTFTVGGVTVDSAAIVFAQ